MHVQNNDWTNFWALNRSALIKCLELVEFREIGKLRIVLLQGLSMHMTQINLIARKPERPSVRPYALQDIKQRQFG